MYKITRTPEGFEEEFDRLKKLDNGLDYPDYSYGLGQREIPPGIGLRPGMQPGILPGGPAGTRRLGAFGVGRPPRRRIPVQNNVATTPQSIQPDFAKMRVVPGRVRNCATF